MNTAAETLPIGVVHGLGGADFPENSMEGLKNSLELGYVRIEGDVQKSQAGLLVVHGVTEEGERADEGGDYFDVHFPAKGVVRYLIADITSSDLRDFADVGVNISMLDEIFGVDTAHEVMWNLDAKRYDAVDELLSTVKNHKAFGRVCLASFEQPTIEALRRGAPEGTETSLSKPELFELAGKIMNRDAIALPPHVRAQVPHTYHELNLDVVPFAKPTTDEFGVPIDVWGPETTDRDKVRELIRQNVAGIITDDPVMLKEELAAAGRW